MANRNEPIASDECPRQVDATPQLAERWSRLEPDERTLVAMALAELTAGTFADLLAWERFVAAATDLLPALANGTISAAELHEIAMHHAFDDHD